MARLRQQVEIEHLLVAEEYPADVPLDAFAHYPLGAAETIEDLESTLGPANRPRTDADRVVVVEHEHVDSTLRKVDRRGQAHRSRAGNNDRPMPRRATQVRGSRVEIDGIGVGLHSTFQRLPHL